MKKLILRFIGLLLPAILLSGCSLNIFGSRSGIQITSNPQAEVDINGQSYGKTPYYTESIKPGDYTIKLTPVDSGLQPWETKTTLTSGYITIVDRQFGTSQDQSSNYTLSFEKLSDKNATQVSVVSNPSNVSIAVDKNPAGFSSHPLDNVDPGDHTFDFSAPGYQDKRIQARVFAGQRLVINLTLASQPVIPTPTPTVEATPSATPALNPADITPLPEQSTTSGLTKPYVEILSTPTGWLKVHSDATTDASTVVAKVNPGDTFNYKDMSTSGWYYIEYLSGKWGYVSSQYAKLIQ